jgi:hypothetical protein
LQDHLFNLVEADAEVMRVAHMDRDAVGLGRHERAENDQFTLPQAEPRPGPDFAKQHIGREFPKIGVKFLYPFVFAPPHFFVDSKPLCAPCLVIHR